MSHNQRRFCFIVCFFFFHISFSFGISVWCFVQAFKVIEGGQLICIVAHWWKCAKWIAAHWASVFDFLFLSKNKSIYIHQYCVPPSLNIFASRGKIISSAALSSLNLICAWHSLCLFLSHLHCEKRRRSRKIKRKRGSKREVGRVEKWHNVCTDKDGLCWCYLCKYVCILKSILG